ncbi:hypothetical protein [Nocardia salmonicida]|uniref:hypothetical protein n=1 Tax=Nocardia salmonicida TaxID=53431 RepID=UPI0012F50C5E|nr:hypothetical protein [Nocardia salmonicida]
MSRAIGLDLAVRLARSFELLDDDWGLSPLAEAFAEVIEPGSAQEIAGRVIDLIPIEPVDPVNTLRRVLVDLPKVRLREIQRRILHRVLAGIPVDPWSSTTVRSHPATATTRSAPCCTTACARAFPHRTATNTTTFALTSTG